MKLIDTTLILILRKYKKKNKELFIPLIFMFIANGISILIPVLVMKVLDKFHNIIFKQLNTIIILMVIWFFSMIVISILEYYQKVLFKKIDNEILLEMHSQIIKYHMNKPILDWASINSKENADEIIRDLEDYKPLLPSSIFIFLRNIFIIIITSLVLLIINWKLTLSVALLIPIFLMSFFLWDEKIKEHYKNYRKAGELFFCDLIEFLQTIPLIKIYNSSMQEIKLLESKFSYYQEKQFNYFLITNKRQSFTKFVTLIAPIYLLFCAFIFIYFKLITIGEIFAFWGIFSMLINSTLGITSFNTDLLKAQVVLKKIKKIINPIFNDVCVLKVIKVIDEIKIVNLEYYIKKREKKIKIPSFCLKKGEIIQIQGKSGIGKTTFLKMLIGIFEPLSGDIFINNISISEIDKEKYFNLIGFVEQNGYLYSRTLKDNILLGRKYDKKQWEKTICLTNLKLLINSFPEKENQLLGENSIQLSGGERQRILIARAIYNNPQLLILDEPFTGIDIQNKMEIKSVLEQLDKELSIIFVSHEKESIFRTDKVIYLSN